MSKILIALGGNALGENALEQQKLVATAAISIVELIEEGHEVVICHGNGPQVGMIFKSLEAENMPLAECTSMSQGYIGFHLQKAILNEMSKKGISKSVASLVTQIEVDANDQAFSNFTKPIGKFFTYEESLELEKNGIQMIEDSGRGYRRVVASPKPKNIIEKSIILSLIDASCVVIAGGGGGIPVINNNGELQGIDAVIDKDATASLMAELLDVDVFFILTAIDYVMINFGKENQECLEEVCVADLKKYIKENQFMPGSMLPKIEAAIEFVSSSNSRTCIISDLKNAKKALKGNIGTRIKA